MAVRDEILSPGTYASIPHSLLRATDVAPAAKLVWIAIVDRFGENESAWPGAGQIAIDTGLTRRGVQKALEQLIAKKLLTVLPPLKHGGTNRYQLTEFASAQSSLAYKVRKTSAQSSPPLRTECASGSAQSSHEPLNITTPETTEVSTQEKTAAAVASSASPSEVKAEGGPTPTASPKTSKHDKVIDAVTSDKYGVALAAYLLHGAAAIGKTSEEWKSMPAASTHWAPTSRDASRPDPDCAVNGLAGYVAYKLAAARVVDGQAIMMPDIPKLCGVVKKLRSTMTQEQFVSHVDRICSNWPTIKAALSWMDAPPPLDPLLFHNRHVIEASNRIAAGLPTTANASTSSFLQKQDFRKDGKYAHCYSN